MNKFLMAATIAVVALLGYGAGIYFPAVVIPSAQDRAPAAPAEPEPLYWVAPMDASFRRDGPGKSPMGMDLVPVYASDKSPATGEVSIAPQVQQHLGLRTARAERTTMVTPLTAVGFVGFDQQALRHFHLRATGWVSELSVVAEGDPVRMGQKLFEFYSPEILNTQQEYLSALNGNHTALAQSAALKLKAQGVSEREITAIARERKLRPQLSYYADRDGYVAAISISNGSYVELDQSTLSIGTLDDVWVLAEVFERSAGLLHQGQAVTLTSRSYPGEQWLGEIDYVYPVLNAANRTVKARIVFPNSDGRLKPNMLVDLAIAAAPAENTLVIPTSAVIRTGQSTRVVRQVRDDVYRSTAVRVGRSAGGNTEVLDGLREGDRVVVNAQFLIDSESNVDAELARIGEKEQARAEDSPTGHAEGMDHSAAGDHKMDHSGMSHDEMNHDASKDQQVAP
ncbi:efflux RND transporter periplasmic adaptor subunit [Gilvimarinus agarilyticus]|uniref:efflux RND transporter periplasmic adaptor subunit n=1 Tax=Gilvimarinus agarilyticus TaxID=679259 RepID=UPI00069778FC|nr:efflux RND transporter periplasmic adaptor subunit [Gilvimarinus agarilyticus]